MRCSMVAAASMALIGLMGSVEQEATASEQPREAKRYRTSGSTPVSGGGKRERERRLRKMAEGKQP